MEEQISLKKVLFEQAETAYSVTENLFHRINDEDLQWKPATGKNWMTVSQLLMHCASYGCGKAVRGFVQGDWGEPESAALAVPEAVEHIPPAAALSGVRSVEQACKLLADDKILTIRCLEEVDESQLLSDRFTAPWGGPEFTLFQHLLLMIAHLNQHKGQLFYYLKLMGKDVNSGDLWGE